MGSARFIASFLSSCDLDGCKLGSKRVAWLQSFLSRFDLFLSCFECTSFVNGMASMGSEGILVVCSDGLIGYDDAYL